MAKKLKTQVLIVGAGPTGLMAANQLLRFGIDFIIVDTKSGPTKESRAIVVSARSLEIYQQMGLSDYPTTNGVLIQTVNLYSEGKKKAEVKIGEMGKGQSDFNSLLAFEQSKNEELLSQNLIHHGRTIHWNHEFIELTEHKSGINGVIRNETETMNVEAAYLIACDGAKSPVRHQLNFSFKGGTYDHKFFVADTIIDWDLTYDKLIISPGEKSFCAFIPLQGNKTYRVLGTLPKKYSENEDVNFNDIEKVVLETIGIPIKFESVNWFSIYKLHHRMVNHFSEERVFLAGDSAHIHSPAGGQGMNTGLQDTYNLCWKMAFVLKGYANEKLLSTYNEERLPFAKFLLKFTDRGFNMMTNTNWFVRIFRKYIALNIIPVILKSKKIKQRAFKLLSQTGYSYNGLSLSKSITRQKLQFKAGDRIPYTDVLNEKNKFYLLFTDASFHLLHIGKEKLDQKSADDLKSKFPFPVKLVENDLSDSWKKLGVQHQLFVLVRPDNCIGFIFDSIDEMAIDNYLQTYFSQKKET